MNTVLLIVPVLKWLFVSITVIENLLEFKMYVTIQEYMEANIHLLIIQWL